MKQILLILAVVALVGCGESAKEKAAKAKAKAAAEVHQSGRTSSDLIFDLKVLPTQEEGNEEKSE